MTKFSLRCLQCTAALVVAGTLVTLIPALSGSGRLNHVSGVWITLAVDLADGVFYRPLFSPAGYGGTRFFPLHFLLHAALIRFGLAAVPAGYVLTGVSAAAMIAAVYAWLRRLGATRPIALPITLLLLASAATGLAVTTIRGDLLPAALNAWGLYLCTPPPAAAQSRRDLLAAAACFVLAFSAKVTTVFGFAAAMAALFFGGRRKQACLLAGVTLPGWAAVLLVLHVASAGRATETLLVCASGGASLGDVLYGPLQMLANASSKDFVCFVAIIVAAVGLLLHGRMLPQRLPALAFGSTALITAAIFGSPGTDYNHLLDLFAVSLVCLGALWSKPVPGAAWTALAFCLIVVIAVVANARAALRRMDRIQTSRNAVLERLQPRGIPPQEQLLSQDPMVPILLEQRPFLMDPFMLRISRRHDPRITTDLWARLRRHDFAAVVLMVDPNSPEGSWRLRNRHFGPGFAEQLLKYYALEGCYGMYYLYRPRSR